MFRSGDTVVFDPESFNPDYWNGLSEKDKIKYYGPLGYGEDKLKTFTFITEMHPQTGHCILIDIATGKIETMRHTSNFRLADDEEV
jgi:hypothetical protein